MVKGLKGRRNKGNVKLRISHRFLEGLADSYTKLMNSDYEAENDHEHLLWLHAVYMEHKLLLMVAKDQEFYTLDLNGMEAMAYMQLWQSQPLPLAPYGATVVREILGKLDCKHQNAKLING